MRAPRRFCRSRVGKLVIFSDMDDQRVRILISKGSKADILLEMSIERPTERASAGRFESIRELTSHLPRPMFIYHVDTCCFISRQLALIAWHNAFKVTV